VEAGITKKQSQPVYPIGREQNNQHQDREVNVQGASAEGRETILPTRARPGNSRLPRSGFHRHFHSKMSMTSLNLTIL
jgi:hypothetical protein